MKEEFDVVSLERESLLNVLQSTPAGEVRDAREEKARSRLSDYTQAASHVMEIFLEIYNRNKELTILYEKQKTRINQKFKLAQFDAEAAKVRFCYEKLLSMFLGSHFLFCFQYLILWDLHNIMTSYVLLNFSIFPFHYNQ